ncbi:MAG: THUMP domain-containing protein [Candidatus Caldarchaeum sp.]
MRFFATTFRGLEDVAASEVSGIVGEEAEADVSKVFFTGSAGDCVKVNLASQTVNKVFLLLLKDRAESLETVESLAASVDYTDLITRGQSFAVEAERVGAHPFTSLDIAASVGRAVVESYRAATGFRLRVDLKNPDVRLYVILRGDELLLGLNTTGESLHRRFYRRGAHRAALSPTVANAVVRISGWKPGRTLLDPFCGSGTIPLEAAIYGLGMCPGARTGRLAFQKICLFDAEKAEKVREGMLRRERRGAVDVVGLDISGKALALAEESKAVFGFDCGVRFVQGDVFKLDKYITQRVDTVVCNPPFGVRMRVKDPEKFYTEAFKAVMNACPNAFLTVICNKPFKMLRALENSHYNPISLKKVLLGDIAAYVFSSVGMSVDSVFAGQRVSEQI